MIIEGIKNLLGEDLTKQVETALKGKGKDGKDVDLVIGNDGSFVPAEKYNGANSGKTSAENALKAAAEALKAIGGSGDPAKIAEDVKTAQTTITTLQTNHDAEIKKISKNAALRMALNGKVHDPSDIIGLLDLEKIDVDDAGNLKTDLDGLLNLSRNRKVICSPNRRNLAPLKSKGAKPAEPGAPAHRPQKQTAPFACKNTQTKNQKGMIYNGKNKSNQPDPVRFYEGRPCRTFRPCDQQHSEGHPFPGLEVPGRTLAILPAVPSSLSASRTALPSLMVRQELPARATRSPFRLLP